METGEQVRGKDAVRDFIVALHRQYFDAIVRVRSRMRIALAVARAPCYCMTGGSRRITQSILMRQPEFGTVIVGDGAATLEAVFVGTHIADFAGVPATGVSVRCPTSCPMTSRPAELTPCARTSRSPFWFNS